MAEDVQKPIKRPWSGESRDEEKDLNKKARTEEQEAPKNDHQINKVTPRYCPYLGSINRHVLDFDFEKLCSISLSSLRPYGCLVCGRYFQGRGANTYAMTHALEAQHYLFINLHDAKIYCLPDNWEVKDTSLNDIKYHLNPTFTKEEVTAMATIPTYGKALDGSDFIPGCVGLNNLNQTDCFNVVVQSLMTVVTLRNQLLLLDLSNQQSPDHVYQSLGELARKMFNPKNFKGIVSPHEFLQAVGVASQKRFQIGKQQDPLALLAWLFHRLHKCMKNKKTKVSTIHRCFQGEFLVATSTAPKADGHEGEPTYSIKPFLFMTLDVPEAPIFRDPSERNTIPQLPIFELLQKFDGITSHELIPGKLNRYSIWKLPPYLIIHINRFSRNNFFLEKNPTIITFPVKSFDLREYIHPDAKDANPITRYDLVANTVHEGLPASGSYKCQVYHSATKSWNELEDLRVTPTLPQMVALSESYIQIYQRQDVQPDGTFSDLESSPLSPSFRN